MSQGYSLGQPYGYGRSSQAIVPGATPGAGLNFSLPLDGRWIWRLVSCVFTLTTDATAANRYVTVEGRGSNGAAFVVDAAALTVSASSVQRFAGSASRTVAEWAANTDVLFPLSPVFLHAGETLSVIVAAIQAGDALSGLVFVFDRFPTGGGELPPDELELEA